MVQCIIADRAVGSFVTTESQVTKDRRSQWASRLQSLLSTTDVPDKPG
jgi:hypothetical protein